MVNPDVFLTQEDVPLLVQALNSFALEANTVDDRQNTLINAGVHQALRSKLHLGVGSQIFANKLAACCREYRVSRYQPGYHPLINLLEYLLQIYELEDQDRTLFKRLTKQGRNNLDMLAVRSTIGRIESPLGIAVGTGVLVSKNCLLTCHHVFERGQKQAWVRFGYKAGRYGIEAGELFQLDTKEIVHSIVPSEQTLDYELVRIIGEPELLPAMLSHTIPYPTQNIHLIHHPRGEPVQISEVGQLVLVDPTFIHHNIEADHGSSGAPIFDVDWHVIALHRGRLSLSRPTPPGITEGIPISRIWKEIAPHL